MIRNHSRHGSRFPVTSTSAPGAPTIGTATATGPTTATVSFTQPANDGGSTITSYTATSSPGGITGVLNQAGSGTITITGLTGSTSYTFTVTATNAIGTSAPSAASNSITTDFAITKSLRFRSSASAYLNRTPATATNQKTWTWSGWVKRGALSGSTSYGLFGSSALNANTTTLTFINDTIVFQYESAFPTPPNLVWATAAVYRDPAAWYHIVLSVDTTQASSANAVQLWVNGNSVALTFTAYTGSYVQNTNYYVNGTSAHQIGQYYGAAYFDGELAEVNFVDGQVLAPTAFGATGANSQWLPKAYTGTYGTNGFYLPFTNVTSTSTLVADSSGNANNWTPNNISLTAGSTYDSLTDVPTLTSATVANYAVLNPLSIRSGAPASSDGNLTIAWGGTYPANALATIGVSTGKWYWEVKFAGGTFANNPTVGVAVSAWSNVNTDPTGAATPFSHLVGGVGSFYNNGTATVNAVTFGPGDTVGLALNCDTNVISFYKNNTLIGTAQRIDSGQTWFPFHANSSFTALTQYVNYGQQPFVYPTLPSGFLPLNTFNIAAGTVTTSGTFTGNLSTDGPFVFLNGTPTAMTINGNAVTFGTQADKLANGFKVRSSSASYNASGSNTYTASVVGAVFKYEDAQSNP